MEIRNALQKIENYLTVVSNLNRTILSEGTMSRDELLLMKKYLYTSIDRIEDIERSLLIDKRDDKSFTPTAIAENTFIPTLSKEKEIVEVAESEHMDDVEAVLNQEQKEEMDDLVEEIHAEMDEEQVEMVGEIKSIEKEQETEKNKTTETFVEITPLVESIITEDYSLNKLENTVSEELTSPIAKVEDFKVETTENVSLVESIITEDYSLNKLENTVSEELPSLVAEAENANIEASENTSFVESIITEDYSVNKLFENKEAKTSPDLVADNSEAITPLANIIQEVKNIITEDYALNKNEQTIVSETVVENNEQVSINELTENKTPLVSTLVDKFEEQTPETFAEQLEINKASEITLSEQLEEKLNAAQQPKLFETFDDGKEELHETFSKSTFNEVVNTNFEKPLTVSSYEQDTVLVEDKVETTVDELTPSSLNEIFKPQTIQDVIGIKTPKTLNESIALNDKFIFVRELFGNHFGEYEAGLKDLESTGSFNHAESYCKEKLWNKYNWSDKTIAVERFMAVLHKRFN